MNIVYANNQGSLEIGYAGEEDRTEVRFYYGDLEEEFPGGTVLLQVRRPGEDTKYDISPTDTVGEEHTVSWLVSAYDCAVRGVGHCQLIYSAAGVIAKKKVWRTNIRKSVEGLDVSVPPDWEDATNALLSASSELKGKLTETREYVDETLFDVNEALERANAARDEAVAAAESAASAVMVALTNSEIDEILDNNESGTDPH